jgi:hypothetical protein
MINSQPTCHIVRVPAPGPVDGDLNKAFWQSASELALTLADGSGAPQQPTTVRLAWDGERVYLGFHCIDVDVRATLTERKAKVWQEEAVEAFIAPYGDLRHYFEFQCSPINVTRDVRVLSPNARPNPELFDGEWVCPSWTTATRSLPEGWSAEWSILLADLLEPGAGPVQPGEIWRANLFRIDRWPRTEMSSWSPVPVEPLNFHRPSYFGWWEFE